MKSRSRFFLVISALFLVVFGSPSHCSAESGSLLETGIKYGQIKEYGRAIEIFNQVLKEDPMNERAQFFLAISQWKAGKEDAARESYQAVRAMNSALAGKLENMFPAIAYPPAPRESTRPGFAKPASSGSESPQGNGILSSPPKDASSPLPDPSAQSSENLSEEEKVYRKVEEGWGMADSSIPSTAQCGYLQVLEYEPDNFRAMEGLRDHYIEHGSGYQVRDMIRKMAKAGHISWDECDQQISDYQQTYKK